MYTFNNIIKGIIMKLSKGDASAIIKAYTINLTPMIVLASRYGVTRMAIWKLLKRNGVDTDKYTAANILTVCNWCKKPITKKRCQIRNAKHLYCNHTCYAAWLNRSDKKLIVSRQGMRLARKEIKKHFNLLPGHVVHHIDRNNLNNSISNLMVFASSGEHISYHREGTAIPIFNGSAICRW